jgi:site-specific DNA recombinase
MQRVRAAGAIDVRLAAAKYEIKMLSKRVKDDVNFRKSQNKPHWNAPYGY